MGGKDAWWLSESLLGIEANPVDYCFDVHAQDSPTGAIRIAHAQ
jgi:hypothetical protein